MSRSSVRPRVRRGELCLMSEEKTHDTTDPDVLAIDTIRTLSMDAVERANSGHPGTPMALAPVAYCIWQRFLRYDPEQPLWPARDRFVLSAGHASMLLYSLIHLAGVKKVDGEGKPTGREAVTLEDIKAFRQLDSRCPGHPEYGHTTGVEITTGPLGQGAAASMGMAIAGRWMAGRFDRPGFELFGFDVYALASDGDIMEGVSSEAASLAGHLSLSNLCWVYDSNRVSIEGSTQLAMSEDVGRRFGAYGWNVLRVGDANDLDEMAAALAEFRKTDDRPTLIVVESHIAYGSPGMQDSHEAHGAPLGEEEVKLTKRAYGWPEDEEFLVPDGVRDHFSENLGARGREASALWRKLYSEYGKQHPELAAEYGMIIDGRLPDGWDREIPAFDSDEKGTATRKASGKVLNAIARKVPWFLGGSADLAPSNKTHIEGAADLTAGTPGGRNFHFGVREHAMCGAVSGMALCGLRPYGATFLVFSDYARPAIRLAALMKLPVVYVFTHDSIGLGEDGPTHQPVEHLASLRAIPHLAVIRPADANEVADAWRVVMSLRHRPSALVLTRQSVPVLDRRRYAASDVARGAYVLADCAGTPDVILIGTGSEVSLCVEAHERLSEDGVASRVVSMPSWELFEEQPRVYREHVLPPEVSRRVVVEAGSGLGWERYASEDGVVIGMEGFGASAPGGDLMRRFGFTADNVVAAASRLLGNG
ncbi:MAG: transketolase [Candidatus Eisenbacteria bacterium]|nr:transketolase [Candidatus Eisenbacteria bacterium]